ncbi:hypothetical protein A0H81_10217 [Grifola frondosa]|uniref:Uncharacterized protein n=1 Tax=Grifola frondosa TaxID=5627 RepID=A0A1C7LZ23_GRIFR|nr:hypothetical protein A0H81_10217 [Grifola frondosa]
MDHLESVPICICTVLLQGGDRTNNHLCSCTPHPPRRTTTMHPLIRHYLPYVNLAIASAALAFQTTMLYPWHEELDASFRKLKEEQARQLRDYHEMKVRRLEVLERWVARQEAEGRAERGRREEVSSEDFVRTDGRGGGAPTALDRTTSGAPP